MATRGTYKKSPKTIPYKKRKEGYSTPKMSLTNPKQLAQLSLEKKNIDFGGTLTPTGINGWSAVTMVNGLAQGPGSSNRIGRKVHLKSLYLRYMYLPTTAAGGQARILVVYDKQTNAALPSINDILTGAPDINSPNNLANAERFVTLVDCITLLPGTAGQHVIGAEYRKINLDQMFNTDVSANITAITSGGMYILMCPSAGLVADTVQFATRIRFTDA